MMKILSLIVFVILLAWSWQLVHSTAPLDFETHSDIQAKLVELIENTIKAKKPDTKDIEIIKIWTKNSSDQKITAQFNYKFTEISPAEGAGDGTGNNRGETVTRIIDGEAVLARDYSDNPTVDKWVIQSLQTKGDNISFNEGSLITPDNQATDENPSTTQAQVPPVEPTKTETQKKPTANSGTATSGTTTTTSGTVTSGPSAAKTSAPPPATNDSNKNQTH